MNKFVADTPDSRRNFIKKVALAGISTTVSTISMAIPVSERDKSGSNGMVILFQGDSITDGNRGRNEDPNHIMGHGYAFSIASRVGADFPEKHLSFVNRGISGNKVTDLARRWKTDTLDLKPDVLSILVGINDAHSVINKQEPVPIEHYEATYRSLLTQTKNKFPEVILVLCEPFILPVKGIKDKWEMWSQDVQARQKVVEKLAGDYQTILVKFQPVFDNAIQKAPADYWIWDGIHPTVAGHELMAREWIRQVSVKLPFLKKYE